MIRKQVLLDEKTMRVFNRLKGKFPFVSDTAIIRAALLGAGEMADDDFFKLCKEAYVPIGKPKEGRNE